MASWMFSDATKKCACPRCGANPTCACITPAGRRRDRPHGERVQELYKRADFNITDYQATALSFKDVIGSITGKRPC